MPAEQRDEAVILRRVDYGEADLIITLLCRERGKISALARAARRSKRRFGGALGLFTVSEVELRRRPGSELWTLSAATPRDVFPEITADLAAIAHGSYATELVRELSAPEQPDEDVFDLLLELFAALRAGAVASRLRAFELRLLSAIGLGPVFDRCAACGERDLSRGAVLDPHRGGAVCAGCAAASRTLGVRPLADDARQLLVAAQRAPSLAAADALETEGDAASAARDAMLALISHHVGKPLRSVEFIAKLSGGLRG